MPSRLVKHRPESQLKHSTSTSRDSFSIHQDPETKQTGFFVALLPSDPKLADPKLAQDGGGSTKPPQTKQRLSGLLHGRKTSRPSLSPASPAAVNSSSIPPATTKAAPSSSTPTKAEPVTTKRTTASSVSGQEQPRQSPQRPVPTRMSSTIRTVPSFDERDGATSEDSTFSDNNQSKTASHSSTLSSSINSNGSQISNMSPRIPPDGGGGEDLTSSSSGQKQNGSAENTQTRLEVPNGQSVTEPSRSSCDIPVRESSRGAVTSTAAPSQPHQFEPSYPRTVQSQQPPADNKPAHDGAESNGLPPSSFDSAIGKASIGKTGRVMNKLISDNEALKRDIQIERLRADEAKQTARLLEDKMDRASSDFESRLLEASVTKTLLARKERQVESLQAAVELEKTRATSALDRERIWKEQLEQIREDSKRQVEEAQQMAALHEGRYNAIAGHWKGEHDEVDRKTAKMRAEIAEYVEMRKRDRETIQALKDVCDQQQSNYRDLEESNKAIAAMHETYKTEKDRSLRDITSRAEEAEAEAQKLLIECRETKDKLKWALAVKENIAWAE